MVAAVALPLRKTRLDMVTDSLLIKAALRPDHPPPDECKR
jgi:hypothetical protein